jgi:hypothetical protein
MVSPLCKPFFSGSVGLCDSAPAPPTCSPAPTPPPPPPHAPLRTTFAAATVSIFTTTTASSADGAPCGGTQGNGGDRCDLVAVAACAGADCGRLLLVASMAYAWAGSGTPPAANGTAVWAQPEGFAVTAAFAATPPAASAPAALGGLPTPSVRLPFATPADLPWPGPGGGPGLLVAALCTGRVRDAAAVVALVAAARARYDASAAAFGPAAGLYEPMRAVLAWNT